MTVLSTPKHVRANNGLIAMGGSRINGCCLPDIVVAPITNSSFDSRKYPVSLYKVENPTVFGGDAFGPGQLCTHVILTLFGNGSILLFSPVAFTSMLAQARAEEQRLKLSCVNLLR